jgi:uncharacterized damage-inducible protein DinB
VTAAESAELVRGLQNSRQRLLAVVAGVSEEQFKRRPPQDDAAEAPAWSIAEVLAHLLATEQRATARAEALLSGDPDAGAPESSFDRDAEARLGRTVPVPQIIHGLLAARRRLELSLSAPATLPDAVTALVREDVIEHEAEHAGQIEAIRSRLGTTRSPGR